MNARIARPRGVALASIAIVAIVAIAAIAVTTIALGAVVRPPLEIWGVGAGDEVTLDGVSASPKSTAAPRPFLGDPLVGNAPVTRELPAGAHSVTVRLAGCAERTFPVELRAASKRSIVMLPPVASHCQLPPPPPKAR